MSGASRITVETRALALAVLAVGCADRPLPLPQSLGDLGRAADLARSDLAQADLVHADLAYLDLAYACTDCFCNEKPCTSSTECCSGYCDKRTYTCAPVQPLDLAEPMCPAVGDCVTRGCSCTTSADCCPGLPCIIPPGALVGSCETPPQPDMANPCGSPNDCIQLGGPCTTTCDCCPGVRCILQLGSIYGICDNL
jgi:hypothetical protein